MKSRSLGTFLVVVIASSVIAQQPEGGAGRRGDNRGGAAGTAAVVASPVVEADRRVTFRVRAPKAQSVSLAGDFLEGAAALKKADDGLWSVTVGPLEPDIYYYNFVVDDVRTLDPGNSQAKIGFTTNTITSVLEVRGDKPAFYDITDVPHGEIRLLRYNSKSNGVIRELNIYTPPGYDDDPQRRFPVVYLLHGANNDHYSWYRYGRANDILDNLLAEGDHQTFNRRHAFGLRRRLSADGRRGPRGARGGTGDLYEQDILEDIIPMVDAKYRTIADRKHRAIVGFSMGGGQSSRIGLGHLDTFSHIGVFSAGLSGNAETEPLKALAADVAATNKQIDLLWIACGKDDAAITGARNFSNTLKQIGVDHKFIESEGGATIGGFGAGTYMKLRRCYFSRSHRSSDSEYFLIDLPPSIFAASASMQYAAARLGHQLVGAWDNPRIDRIWYW